MSKVKTVFSCQKCGYQSAKWLGKCPDCNSWNTFLEERFEESNAARLVQEEISGITQPVLLKDVESLDEARTKTGIVELDRVLGGGIVGGSVILIGGDPGVGKSTISLQISNQLTQTGNVVLYVSGEESVAQTKLRAQRLGNVGSNKLYIVNQTDITYITEYIKKLKPSVVIIDSIQVIFDPSISSSSGSVSQVRECAAILTRLAKTSGIAIFMIGHVTKEGTLAGPRVLEHVVDTVLYFEGDRFAVYRVLRAVKNRFGSTNEIGVFEMTPQGLKPVDNPSALFLSERASGVSGSGIVSVSEGLRSFLVEVQALTSKTGFGYASRRAHGFDLNRLLLLVAVLEKRLGLHLETEDVFVNVVGGFKLQDPSADLGVCAAIVSSFRDVPIDREAVIIGEVGLSGEIRSVSSIGIRINEAEKLGFKRCLVPKNAIKGLSFKKNSIEIIGVTQLKEALDVVVTK